ncbi:MAG: TolC family protein, partial [Steroidobacteraceae bacterium]
AAARTSRISQQESCTRLIDALVALSGQSAASVSAVVKQPITTSITGKLDGPPSELGEPGELGIDPRSVIPLPPPFQPALPATVILAHPNVVAAERETAATWSEIAVSRANRLPKIDLAAMLSGNWLAAFGQATRFQTWSVSSNLSAPLIDGGAGAANVRSAQARYREAVATLRETVRTTVQNIEDALAERQSAEDRIVTSQQELAAAEATLRANEQRWRAGSISQFDLQIARRQYTSAQDDAIAARRDRALAWVDLVLASNTTTQETRPGLELPEPSNPPMSLSSDSHDP